MNPPEPFVPHGSGALLHGTKADLAVGDVLMPGRPMNYDETRVANHVYVTATDAAVWAAGVGIRGRAWSDLRRRTRSRGESSPKTSRACAGDGEQQTRADLA